MGIFIKGGGGKGGGLESIVAGTGISVDITDPDNPIVSSTVTDTNDAAKVSANDTTAGYLNGKLVAGTGVTLTENNNGGNETLTIATTVTNTDETAKVSSNDTTAGYLNGKLVAGTGITLTENNNGGNETLTIAASGGGGGSSDITYYTASLADCENTTTKTDLVSATIPANTWADGEQVTLKIAGDLTTNGSVSLTMGVEGTGFGPYTRSANVNVSSDPNRFTAEFRFMRNGAGIYYYVGGTGTWSESPYLDIGLATLLIGSFGGINSVSDDWLVFDSSVDYTTNITIAITSQWGTASANTWIRPFWGNAYKEKGTAL